MIYYEPILGVDVQVTPSHVHKGSVRCLAWRKQGGPVYYESVSKSEPFNIMFSMSALVPKKFYADCLEFWEDL